MNRAIGWVRGLFLLGCLGATAAVAGYGVTLVGHRQWTWQETFRARAEFAAISGLQRGDAVRVQGAPAGVVDSIAMPTRPGAPFSSTGRFGACGG